MDDEVNIKTNTNVMLSRIPSFIHKLWILVDDPKTDALIRWDKNGHSFHIVDPDKFAHYLLPRFFKHANISSFIRQLNMYGFRKVTDLEQGITPVDAIHYCHPAFCRSMQSDLIHIKRNITRQNRILGSRPIIEDMESASDTEMNCLLSDMQRLKLRSENLESVVEDLKYEINCLNEELSAVRSDYSKQQQIINKLISVIVTFFGSVDPKLMRKNPLPQLLEWFPQLHDSQEVDIPQSLLPSIHPNEPLAVNDISEFCKDSSFDKMGSESNYSWDYFNMEEAFTPPTLGDWTENEEAERVSKGKEGDQSVILEKTPKSNSGQIIISNRIGQPKKDTSNTVSLNTWRYNRQTNSFNP